ncbi:MAG: hypothetical protein ACLTSZ_13695 [Lachnospiraceae bacterium]
MLYTIKNEALKVVIDDRGAELHSIQTLDGTEYLWQGGPASLERTGARIWRRMWPG